MNLIKFIAADLLFLVIANFRHGYDQQYNSYQNQESTQGTSINIYGNNNYVNTNQYSGQNQQ
jgi:hypothetical protein